MNTTKHLRRVAALAALAVALAACGADTLDEAEAETDGSSAPTDEEADAVEETADPVTLSVWIMGDSATAFEELVADFEQSTDINLEVEAIPWDSVNDKLTTAVASGSGPDVTQIGLSLLPQFESAGALLDLSGYLDEHPGIAPEVYVDAAADLVMRDGVMSSIPWVSDTRVLFYRSDILADAGFDAPPSTWDELYDVAVTLSERGDDQYGYYIPQWDRPLPVLFTWQAGGEVVADGEVAFDSPEFREAVEFYTSFHASGAAPTTADFDQTLGFITGVTPMLVSGPYLARAVAEQAPELEGAWSVALLPENENRTSLFAGSNLGVWHNTEHADEALQLLEYLSTPSTQLAWFDTTNELPTAIGAVEDPSLAADPLTSIYMEQLQESRPLPLEPWWDPVNGELLNTLNEVILTDAELDDGLARLDDWVAANR